ncbi:MAG: rubrerythrin family protein [Chthoniobacteraceae bacterium]
MVLARIDSDGVKAYLLLALMGCLAFALPARGAANNEAVLTDLATAYQGEANAHERYALFAKKADEEGFPQVAKLFRAASYAEQIHRDNHKAAIEKMGGQVPAIVLEIPKVGSTRENLESAIKGETYESKVMYPEFLKRAKEAKASPAVRTFTFAQEVETEHNKLYQAALDHLGQNQPVDYYVCPVCGNTDTSLPAKRCDICGTPVEEWKKIE